MLTLPRLLLIAHITAGMAAMCQTSTAAKPAEGIGCVTDMEVPAYRGVAWHATAVGTANATILLDSRARPRSIDVQASHPALADLVKRSLTASTFAASCAGQTLAINFVYRLAGDPDSEPRNEVRWQAPNTFEITARPPLAIRANP